MKTIFGSLSAALAGATAQSIAAAANRGQTAVLNLRFKIFYPFTWLFLTGWEPAASEGPRASEDDRPAWGTSLRLILLVSYRRAAPMVSRSPPMSSRRSQRLATSRPFRYTVGRCTINGTSVRG